MLVIIAEGFLKLPNLLRLVKQKSHTSQKIVSRDFFRIANSFLKFSIKVNLLSPTLFVGLDVFLHLIEQNCLLRTLISVTQVITQKVIANLDSSEGSGPDSISVVDLQTVSLKFRKY